MTNENYDRLWRMIPISDKQNDDYAKYFNVTEHLATDDITVLLKGQVICKQYTQQKHKRFGKNL
jgi:hypothetical protein